MSFFQRHCSSTRFKCETGYRIKSMLLNRPIVVVGLRYGFVADVFCFNKNVAEVMNMKFLLLLSRMDGLMISCIQLVAFSLSLSLSLFPFSFPLSISFAISARPISFVSTRGSKEILVIKVEIYEEGQKEMEKRKRDKRSHVWKEKETME